MQQYCRIVNDETSSAKFFQISGVTELGFISLTQQIPILKNGVGVEAAANKKFADCEV